MGIGDYIGVVSAIIGMAVSYPAFLLLLNIGFGNLTSDATERLQVGLIWPFFVGMGVAFGGGFAVIALLSTGGPLQLIGVLLLIALLFFASIGIAAVARRVGQRISQLNERENSTFYQILVGAITLTLALGFPLVGWFVLIPLTNMLGMGVFTITALRIIFRRDKRERPPEDYGIPQGTSVGQTTAERAEFQQWFDSRPNADFKP